MTIDPKTAAAFGFPKPHYTLVERERRWLCRGVPRSLVVETEAITDLYVTDSRLRLREARPIGGGAPRLCFTRKADVDARTRLVTSIYLPEEEFAVLARSLPGMRLKKLRHRLREAQGVTIAVDEFEGDLRGLLLAEAEFDTEERLATFPMPEFALREVTDDPRYTGSHLARYGLPSD
jgi:CYTH domain-containing protein